MKLSVVIPAYNEQATIARVVDKVRSADISGLELEIVVVDDGSTDKTAEVLRALPGVRALLHERNRGKGAAVKTGFAAATGDLLIIQDADLEYDPADYAEVLRPLLEGRADAVMGSRFLMEPLHFFLGPRKSPYFTHYIGNKLIVALTNLLYRHSATDYEGGTKAFRKEIIDTIAVQADGFEYDNELICRLLRRGCRIVEVPIQYRPRNYREGKKIGWRDGLRMLWTILRWRFKGD